MNFLSREETGKWGQAKEGTIKETVAHVWHRTATLGSNLNISTAIRMVRAYDVQNSGSPESAAFPNSSKLKILYNRISVILYVKRSVLTARLKVGKQHNWTTTCGCVLKKERLRVNYPPTILERQQNIYRTFRKVSVLMYNQSPGAALLVDVPIKNSLCSIEE